MKAAIAATLAVLLVGAVSQPAKAVSIYDASYDGSGNITNTIVQLDTFIVIGLYNNNTAFISDGSGYYGRIYKPTISSFYAVGQKYSGVTVATQAYFGYAEFTSPTGGTLDSSDNPVSFVSITDLGIIASDVVLAGSPSAGENFNLNFMPVTFTFSPTETTALSSTGTITVADASGKSITFYRSVLDSNLEAGQSYQINGYIQGFNTAMQVVGATVTPVPEPGTFALLALGGGMILWTIRRARGKALPV